MEGDMGKTRMDNFTECTQVEGLIIKFRLKNGDFTKIFKIELKKYFQLSINSNRIVVSTLRCGRSNPGSNPSYGSVFTCFYTRLKIYFFISSYRTFFLMKFNSIYPLLIQLQFLKCKIFY